MTGSATDETPWRETLLNRVGYVCLAIFIGAAVLTLFLRRPTALLWFGVMLGLAFVLLQLMSRRGASYRARAWVVVVFMLVASAIFYVFAGINPGPVLSGAFSLLMTAMLLGRTAFIVALSLMAAFLIGFSVTMWMDLWPGPQPAVSILPTPTTWLLTTMVTVVFWLGLGASVLFVVAAVETNVERLREAHRRRLKAEAIATQAQKLEGLAQLSAGIAHDFNNSLLVVRGWNEILREDDSAETRAQATAAISQAINQSEELTNRLLTFGRNPVRTPHYLAISEVVESTGDTLRRVVPSAVKLRVDVRESGFVFANEAQLQQLLLNLVINARDAVSEGGHIDVRCRRAEASEVAHLESANPGSWVLIEVGDDGIGMDEATQERIFEPFFTTKKAGKGTGLGLASVLGIVTQCKASITVSSEPGEGSRFRIFLPSVEVAPKSQTAAVEQEAPAVHSGRVFVLEDDPLARELLVFALAGAGFATVEASNGDEALELLAVQDEPFDLLSTDAVFPGADLDQVIAAFERHNPGSRILICSGYIPEDIHLTGIESGRYEYLPKPFNSGQLVAKIVSMLGRPAE